MYDYPYTSANNHVLNSLLAKWSTALLGFSPFVLRLGNLLGAAVYLGAGYALVRRYLPNLYLAIPTWLIWIGNPYLADFQGLCRGYGLSVALESAAIWAVVATLEQRGRQTGAAARVYLAIGIITAALAAWTNFVALHFFTAVVILPGADALRRRDLYTLYWIGGSTLALAALLYEPIRKIREHGDFGWFGNTGFWEDTVLGLANTLLLGQHYFGINTPLIVGLLIIAILAGSALLAGRRLWKNRLQLDTVSWMAGLFPLVILINLALVVLTSAAYLNTRITLFLYPPAVIALLELLDAGRKRFGILRGVAGVLGTAAMANFLYNANLTRSYEWYYDQDTIHILDFMEALRVSEGRDTPYLLNVYCLQEPSFQFYMRHNKEKYESLLQPIREVPRWMPDSLNTDVEFYYVERQHLPFFAGHYGIVWASTDGERVLLKKK